MQLAVTSREDHGSVIIYFMEEGKLNPAIRGDYFVGTPFMSTTTEAVLLQSYFPTRKESVNYVLVSVPINLAIGEDTTLASGKLDNNVYQHIEFTHGKHGTLYLDAMEQHNVPLQAAAISNNTVLLSIFPQSQDC